MTTPVSAPRPANDPAPIADTVETAAAAVAAIEQETAVFAAPVAAAPPAAAQTPAAATAAPAEPVPATTTSASAAQDKETAGEPAQEPAEPAAAERIGYPLPIAAAIVLAACLGWGGGMLSRPSASQGDSARLGKALEQLTIDMAALKESVAQGAARNQPPSLAPVLSRLDVLAEAGERTAKDMQGRIAALARTGDRSVADKALADKALADALGPLAARLERIEKTLVTGSVTPAGPVALAGVAQPLPPKPNEVAKLPGFQLREVDDGIAVITDQRGALYEVMRGEALPGAGRVQKIERRAGAWVVVTDKGLIGGR